MQIVESGHVFVAWRAPFAERQPILHAYRPGMTLAEMVGATPGLPIDFARRGVVMIGGHEIARRHWCRVRPKADHTVTLHYALQGGGEGRGRKSGILGLIVGIAAIALSVFTLGGGLAGLGGVFAQGGAFGLTGAGTAGLGLRVLALGISESGSLLHRAMHGVTA